MFDFDGVDKKIEEELDAKVISMKQVAWRQKAEEQGISLARSAVQDQINEAKMSLSLLDAQTKEFSYVKTVIDQLDSILNSMPYIGLLEAPGPSSNASNVGTWLRTQPLGVNASFVGNAGSITC